MTEVMVDSHEGVMSSVTLPALSQAGLSEALYYSASARAQNSAIPVYTNGSKCPPIVTERGTVLPNNCLKMPERYQAMITACDSRD